MPVCRGLPTICPTPADPGTYHAGAMGSGEKRLNGPRCSATTKAGEPCRALAGADGLCTAHSGKLDMRELGHRGGKARRKGAGEELPAAARLSLRETLRDQLDHETIKAAIERALAGGNESARVAAVKFLADLELYRGDDHEAEQTREKLAEQARGELEKLIPRVEVRLSKAELPMLDRVIEALCIELALERKRAGEPRIAYDLETDRGRIIDGLLALGLVTRDVELVDLGRARRELEREREEVAALRAELTT